MLPSMIIVKVKFYIVCTLNIQTDKPEQIVQTQNRPHRAWYLALTLFDTDPAILETAGSTMDLFKF